MMMQLTLFLSSSFQVQERYLILLFSPYSSSSPSPTSFSSFPTWHNTNNRKDNDLPFVRLSSDGIIKSLLSSGVMERDTKTESAKEEK